MMSMAADAANEYASGNNAQKSPYTEEEKGDNAGAMRAKGGNLQPGFAAGGFENQHMVPSMGGMVGGMGGNGSGGGSVQSNSG